MIEPLTIAVHVAVGVLVVVAGWYLVRDRIVDDGLLLVAAVLELLLIVQAVLATARSGHVVSSAERATFVAYALTLPFVPPAVAFLALKEKSRWAMGTVVGGALAVAVMTVRLDQIWGLGG
ncbi:hypothetical protein [Janibacter massiliensis]|uniref:hypothetical protein n=1 Tax=Janibacter massiliensis TaxID=2058291 RepID=UPI000D1029B7|nr:hypothetical protein [Janibacter massiliensis]